MNWGIGRLEMAEVRVDKELTHYLRGELEHVVVHVPGLIAVFQLIKYGEGRPNDRDDGQDVLIYRLRSHGGDHELVGLTPNIRIGAGQKDAGMGALDSVQRVSAVDLLAEEGGLFEYVSHDLRVVGVIHRSAHDGGLKDAPVRLEEPLMIA